MASEVRSAFLRPLECCANPFDPSSDGSEKSYYGKLIRYLNLALEFGVGAENLRRMRDGIATTLAGAVCIDCSV